MKENRINNFGIRQLSIMGSCFFHTKIYKEDKTMKEFWNAVQFVFTAVGGWLGYFLGGCDGLLYALIVFVAIDYITGVMCAINDKALSSEVGFKGICRKVLIFLLVGIANILDLNVIGTGSVLRTAVIFFYISNEGVDNKGEVPQYYVEGHHEGIVTADQFEQVQAELYRRQNMDRYSGVGCFSSIIKCGECGSWYGAKVWHSNDKYRRVIYRCNKKYGKGCKCKTPHITEDEIKEMFIKATNELFSEKDEIIENTKTMMDMVCNTDDLDKELGDKVTELNIIAEQMQTAIAENSRTALDQNEYERRYADFTERYNTIKADYDKISEQIESKKAQRELFKGFIRALEKQGALVEEFDEGLWSSLVQKVVVKSKDDILFIFKNGFKIKPR